MHLGHHTVERRKRIIDDDHRRLKKKRNDADDNNYHRAAVSLPVGCLERDSIGFVGVKPTTTARRNARI